jgi:taurine dioxygenase
MSQLQVRSLTPGFGAEIVGFEFQGEVDEPTRRQLRETFDGRGLLLFRGLDIDRTAQAYLSELVITDEPLSLDDAAEIAAKQDGFWISNKEPGAAAPFGRLLFHSDMMWSDDPFQVLSLYGVDIEPPVVPTIFASAVSAWETLADDLRTRAEKLRVLHVTGPEGFDDRRRGLEDGDLVNPVREQTLSRTTPIGLRHPRTGRTLLYASQGMTKEVVGLPVDQSEDLLEALFDHLYRPADLWQHEWRNGDLIIWDNLAVQHARSAVSVDGPARTLRKIGSPIPTVNTEVQTYQKIG